MASALIVYGSTTGNTAYVAEVLGKELVAAGHDVKIADASDVKPDNLCGAYDAAFFGCSTWGEEEIEFQDDFLPLFEKFEKINIAGKKSAAFGCGDISYTYFCGAVDEIEKKLGELGAEIIADSLKIDGDPYTEKEAIDTWVKSIIAEM